MNDTIWMQQAYGLAVQAGMQGEVPVGAVLVSAGGEYLAGAGNQVLTDTDPCAHAEILAIRKACTIVGNHRLVNTTLYVTLEPCPLCAAALVHARIARLVFATRDFKTGAAGSVMNLLNGSVLNHQVQIDEGVMQGQCALLLQDFFNGLRGRECTSS